MVARAGQEARIGLPIHSPFATRLASTSRTMAWTPGRSRHISGTATSCTRCATPSLRRIDSVRFGGI